MREGFLFLGTVGVDSGQLMVCDPCYIASQWEETTSDALGKTLKNGVIDSVTGRERVCGIDFDNWMTPMPEFGGKCMNEMVADNPGRFQPIEAKPTGEFSYGGCCAATLSEGFGELNYRAGHSGAGVVFSSGYGDGCYQVWGRKNSEGRIIEVRVFMGLEE